MQAGSEQTVLDATSVVIETQNRAGIDLSTDGELYRYAPNIPGSPENAPISPSNFQQPLKE